MLNVEALAEANELKVVYHASAGDGYSWHDFAIWVDPNRDNLWFWHTDSGCSCNYFLMEVSRREHLQVGTRNDVLRAILKWSPYYDYSKSKIAMAVLDYRRESPIDPR